MLRIALIGASLISLTSLAPSVRAGETVFHVAVGGRDDSDGSEAKPFATIRRAQQAVRKKVAAGLKGDVRVLIHGGAYRLEAPLRFGPADSGTEAFEVIYTAAGDQKVVLSGGRPISGWKKAKGKLWTAKVPQVKAGEWYFRELFVTGRRAIRARTPNADAKAPYVHLADAIQSKDKATYQVRLAPELVKEWANVEDVEIVIHGNWAVNRKRFQHADPKTGLITLLPPHAAAIPWNRPSRGRSCYLENAHEMLDRPGEWYLDRKSGAVTYWPREGENMAEAEAVAPVLTRLVEVIGTAETPVRNLHFERIHFEHVAWPLPAGGYHGIQACHYITAGNDRKRPWPGIEAAIYCEHARRVRFTDGGIAHLGGSGVFLGPGCEACEIGGNHVHDIAANGIMVAGPNDEKLTPKRCRIANNHVHATGAEYFGACAIWVGFAEGTAVVHNRVHDVPYTGISVGWQWNPEPTACKKNVIEHNHVHDVMKLLADGGCIYTLGYQPGTVLRGNLLHEVHRSPYTHGGAPNNGVFIDQGSKGYLFERNVIYDTHGGAIRFNQCRREWHTWKDNVLDLPPDLPPDAQGTLLCTGKTALDVPHAAKLDPPELTLEAWIYLSTLPAGRESRRWIVNKNRNEWAEGYYGLLLNGSAAVAYLNIGGGRGNHFTAASAPKAISPRGWHHLAMTYDGADLKVYVDGRPAGKAAVGRKRKPGSTPLTIGARQDRHSFFRGLIDEVRLYDRALSAEEIKARAAAARSAKLDPSAEPKGLVGRWSFDDRRPVAADSARLNQIVKEVRATAGLEPEYRKRLLPAS